MPFDADIPTSASLETPPAIVISNNYQPRHSSIRKGFELSSMDFDGGPYAAIGFRSGLRAVGAEIGHKFCETTGGFRTGIVLTSYYNWVKDDGDTELKYIMAAQNKIGHHGRLLYDVTMAYNFSSGAYASATAKREFFGNHNFGIFQDVTPYVSATVSTDKGRQDMRLGFTTVVDFINDSRLRLDFATKFTQHNNPIVYLNASIRFK